MPRGNRTPAETPTSHLILLANDMSHRSVSETQRHVRGNYRFARTRIAENGGDGGNGIRQRRRETEVTTSFPCTGGLRCSVSLCYIVTSVSSVAVFSVFSVLSVLSVGYRSKDSARAA